MLCDASWCDAMQEKVENAMMQRDKLAASPNLRKSSSGRTNTLAVRAVRVASPREEKGPCPPGTRETSRNSRGHEKEKRLALDRGSKQAEKAESAMQCKGDLGCCQMQMNANTRMLCQCKD